MLEATAHPLIFPSDVPSVVRAHARAMDSVLLWAGAGVGKSDILGDLCRDAVTKRLAWTQWAAATGKPIPEILPDLEFVPLVLSQITTDEFLGVPWHLRGQDAAGRETRITVPAPMSYFVGDGPKLILLDEVTAADPRMMKAILQIVNDRKVSGVPLAPGTIVVLAANRAQDRAGVKQLLFTLGNRLAHYELGVSVADWIKWATRNGIPAPFIAYVLQHSDPNGGQVKAIHNYDIGNPSPAQLTPRSFAKAALAWAAYDSEIPFLSEAQAAPAMVEIAKERIVLSRVGSVDGHKINAFLRLRDQIPAWEEILASPEEAKLPAAGSISTVYYLMSLFVDRLGAKSAPITDQDLASVVTYWDRVMDARPESVDASAWALDMLIVQGAASEPAKKTKGPVDGGNGFRLAREIRNRPRMAEILKHFVQASQQSGVWAKV